MITVLNVCGMVTLINGILFGCLRIFFPAKTIKDNLTLMEGAWLLLLISASCFAISTMLWGIKA